MKRQKISRKALLQELRKLLVSPETTIVKRNLTTEHAKSTWKFHHDQETGDYFVHEIKIAIDVRRDSPITLVLHELLHIFMSLHLNIDKKLSTDLEETVILGLERHLYSFLCIPSNEKLLQSWNRAVERKMK
jgi:hypothetical protein